MFTVVESDFLFLDYKDWFVQPHDRRANLGRRIGQLSLSVPKFKEIENKLDTMKIAKFLNAMDVHEKMKVLYFKFQDNIPNGSEFMADIYNELSQTHHENLICYQKTSRLDINGIFIPMGFMLKNSGRILVMGNQTYEKCIKHLEKRNEIAIKT